MVALDEKSVMKMMKAVSLVWAREMEKCEKVDVGICRNEASVVGSGSSVQAGSSSSSTLTNGPPSAAHFDFLLDLSGWSVVSQKIAVANSKAFCCCFAQY